MLEIIKNIDLNIFGFLSGLYIFYFGITKKNPKIAILGTTWMIFDYLMVYKKNITTEFSNIIANLLNIDENLMFGILYMFIPAWIMAYFLFTENYKYNNKLIFLFVLGVFIIDNIHFVQHSKKKAIYIIIAMIGLLCLIRLLNPQHYDDVYPTKDIFKEGFENSKYLFVIPKYNGVPITNYPDFCDKLKKYASETNKKLCLHGIEHIEYQPICGKCEFSKDINISSISEGIKIFKDAFGFEPKYFKAPCYGLTENNEKNIKKLGMKIFGPETLIFNKLYHNKNENLIIDIVNKINYHF